MTTCPTCLDGVQLPPQNCGGINNMLPYNAIQVYQGASKTLELTITDCEGNPVDITGAKLVFTVKEPGCGNRPIIQKTTDLITEIEITQPRLGIARIYLQPVDTQYLIPGHEYIYDVWLILPSGKRYVVIPPTTFQVLGAVTILPP